MLAVLTITAWLSSDKIQSKLSEVQNVKVITSTVRLSTVGVFLYIHVMSTYVHTHVG